MTDERVISLEHLQELVRSAKEVVDAVSFDMNGMALPNMFSGGNGGLISQQTLQKCDKLRRATSRLEHLLEG